MRIATWNVNSIKARMEKISWWLERTAPDVLLMQETKLTDKDARVYASAFEKVGYAMVHHGEGGRNGVAIASKLPITDVIVNFGLTNVPGAPKPSGAADKEPLAEARMISAMTAGIRFVCLYAPNGRIINTPTYEAKLVWYDFFARWLEEMRSPDEALIVGGDLNVTPDDRDVWDAKLAHGGTHVSPKEREAFARLLRWGLIDSYRKHTDKGERFTWWDYRAGDFYKNFGMRLDVLLLTKSVASRTVFAEIDREARKGKPTPSDHAPYVLDLDEPGLAFDPGWSGAEARIAARRGGKRSE